MFYFLWGVFRVSRKDCSNLPTDKLTSGLEPNFNEDPRAPDPSTSVLSSSLSFSKDRDSFAKQNTSLLRSANYVPSLEGNPGVCLNGESSMNQPVSESALDDHLDSTNSNGAVGPSAMATGIKHQVNTYIFFCLIMHAYLFFYMGPITAHIYPSFGLCMFAPVFPYCVKGY